MCYIRVVVCSMFQVPRILWSLYLENLPHCKASTSSSSWGLSLIKHSPWPGWPGCPRCSVRIRIHIRIRWTISIVHRCHSRNVCLSFAAGQLTFNYPTVDWVLPCPLIKWSIEQSISCCRCLNRRCIVHQLHQSCGQRQRQRERERHLLQRPFGSRPFDLCCILQVFNHEIDGKAYADPIVAQSWTKLQSALYWFTKIRTYTISYYIVRCAFE